MRVTIKSFESNVNDDVDKRLEIINSHTITPLTKDEVFLFDVVLCDNDVDRVGDRLSDKFLEEFAEKSKTLVGLKDHDWSSDGQLSRLYDTEVVTVDGETNSVGEPYKQVIGHAYTLQRFEEFVDRIRSGLLKECSVSFESQDDRCSICGGHMEKGVDSIAVCENGHVAGNTYEGKLCYNDVNTCTDVFEWSLVAVPCQRRASIKNKGGKLMKRSLFMFAKAKSNAAFKSLPEDVQMELEEVANAPDDAEVSEDEVNALIAENEELKARNKELEDEVAMFKAEEANNAKIKAVEKAVDELKPLTAQVKQDILDKIDLGVVEVGEDGIVGLDEQLGNIKKAYEGLFVPAEEEKKSGDDEEKGCGGAKKALAKKSVTAPTFSVGVGRDTSKKSFHDACKSL